MRTRNMGGTASPVADWIGAVVAAEAPKRIGAYLRTRDQWNLARDLTDLSGKVAHEYQNRFVIELIQNAYDAHPATGRDGLVHVRLDATAGEYGVLYVANGGRPFTDENFEALTSLSRSNKPPGEGIGNKGIGFRSVLEICRWPEVYSCAPGDEEGERLDGFCFRFARDADVRALVATDEEHALVMADISPYFLPIPAAVEDQQVLRLRHAGTVTVIRLPLLSALALQKAEAQLGRVLDGQAPIMLFLERLAGLTIELVGKDGVVEAHQLTRSEVPIELGDVDGAPTVTEVRCDNDRFVVATRRLPQDQVLDAIETSIAAQALDGSWRKWQGEADVSVAVPLDDAAVQGLHYTYLPMEDASPLRGHVNAPYYTKLARTHLDTSHPLNSLLLDTAAELCLTSAELLTRSDLTYRDRVATDLVTWEQELHRMQATAERRGTLLEDLPVLPCLTATGELGWSSLGELYDWTPPGEQLSARRLAQVGAPLLHPELGEERRARVRHLHDELLDRSMVPEPEELAPWVEQVAILLHQEAIEVQGWIAFYSELAEAFPGGAGTELHGRKILLDEAGKLRHAGPPAREWRGTTVFLPPRSVEAQGSEDELRMPARLQRAVTYLHDGIPLLQRQGTITTRTAIANFLEPARLVERYELREILDHLRRLAERTDIADSTRAEALRWIYRQHRAARASGRTLDLGSFPVPTSSGWVRADRALFSAGWPETRGLALERLLALTTDASPALRSVERRLLLPPDDWPVPVREPAAWRDFLRSLGVRDGLWPERLETPPQRRYGSAYDPQHLASHVDMPEESRRRWVADVRQSWPRAVQHPQTRYLSSASLWHLPGQDVIESLGSEARDAYALLVLLSIDDWPSQALTYTFALPPGHRSGTDTQNWPTPAATFLRTAVWFPMSQPGRREEVEFARLSRSWHFAGSRGDAPPSFAPLCNVQHRRAFEYSQQATARLQRLGLRLWDEPGSAGARLDEIARLVGEGALRPSDVNQVKRACEAAWSDLARGLIANVPRSAPVVTRGTMLETVDRDGAETVYVPDGGSTFTRHILDAAERPVLVVDPKHGAQVAGPLERSGVSVRRISETTAEVTVDGALLRPEDRPGLELVDDLAPWLPMVMAPAIELQSHAMVHVTPASVQRALARLRRIRLVSADRVSVEVDGHRFDAAELGRGSLHVEDETAPLLVRVGRASLGHDLGWTDLAAVADDLAALIGQPGVADRLHSCALALDRALGGGWTLPDEEQVAAALRTTPGRVREIWLSLQGHVDRILRLVAVEVGWLVDAEAGRALIDREPGTREELLAHLDELLANGAGKEATVERAERCTGFEDLRQELDADLANFNALLRALGYDPLHFTDRHRVAFNHHVERHRDDILLRLRLIHLDGFRRGEDLSAYTAVRGLGGLGPDPDWLEEWVVPSGDLMVEHVRSWLAEQGELPAEAAELPPLGEVRQANTDALEGVVEAARPLVTAWASANGRTLSPAWASTVEIVRALHNAGALDFEELSSEELLRWLAAVRLWPEDMPLSRDLDALGMPPDALTRAAEEAARVKEDRERERREIVLGERRHEATEDGYRDLVKAVQDGLSQTGVSWSKSVAKLREVTPRGGGGGGGGGGPGGRRRRMTEHLSDRQRAAIGLVGEVVAYEWLCEQYVDATEASWVSGYRQFALGGEEGDDTLGYDFEVRQASRTLLFEVKATSGDSCEFELGTSELRAARSAPKDTYRVLFVRNTLQPEQRELLVLPNPLEGAYRGLFAQVNQGVRLAFDPDPS